MQGLSALNERSFQYLKAAHVMGYNFELGASAFCTSSNTRSAIPLLQLVWLFEISLHPHWNDQPTMKIDNQHQSARNNAQPGHSTCPFLSQHVARQFSMLSPLALHSPWSPEVNHYDFGVLTSQSDVLRDNLQVLWLPQLRTHFATPPHDVLTQLLVPLSAPIVVFTTSA